MDLRWTNECEPNQVGAWLFISMLTVMLLYATLKLACCPWQQPRTVVRESARAEVGAPPIMTVVLPPQGTPELGRRDDGWRARPVHNELPICVP